MRRLGVDLTPDRPARGLSIADQQIVEIAKALSFDARVLIMDEPTAALTGSETARLFSVVRTLRARGRGGAVHLAPPGGDLRAVPARHDPARRRWIASEPLEGLTEDDLVRRMVGRDLDELYPKQDAEAGEVALSRAPADPRGRLPRRVLRRAPRRDRRASPDSSAPGAPRSPRPCSASTAPTRARSRCGGHGAAPGSPTAAMDAGLALVPEDRRQRGLVMDMSIERNIGLTGLRDGRSAGSSAAARARAAPPTGRCGCRLKYSRLADTVGVLSGGNQQKVVLAKWLATGPAVLIVDEPTRGIDVGTKAEVHRLLSALAADGLAVLMISSDLPEVLGMADRVLVMHEGRLVAEIPRAEATEESVMAAATGRRRTRGQRHDHHHREPARTPPKAPERAGAPPGSWTRSSGRGRSPSRARVLLILGTWRPTRASSSDQGIKDLLLNASILVLLAVGQSARRDHPQHRPVRRLRRRPVRLRLRQVRPAAATTVSRPFCSASRSASSAAWSRARSSASAGCPRSS